MTLFRIGLTLRSALGTPLSSGTIFGHLCWAYRESKGEAALVAWLATLDEHPWAVSNGFPAGYLPRPLLPAAHEHEPRERLTKEALDKLTECKRRRKLAFVPRARWRDLKVGASAERIDAVACGAPSASVARIAHNTIDRRSGTTPETAGLWFVDEWRADRAASAIDVYVRADAPGEEIVTLFRAVGERGYGRDATIGRGAFEVTSITVEEALDAHPTAGGGRRLVSLSEGSVSSNMRDACYKLTTHYGKVGRAMLTTGARPWKLPILLTRPGATFAAEDDGPFGAWLTDVHQDRAEIGHNAFHVAIPFTFTGGRA